MRAAAPAERRGRGAAIRNPGCFPSSALLPFQPQARPDSLHAQGTRSPGMPLSVGPQGLSALSGDSVGPTALGKAANPEYSPAPALAAPLPLSPSPSAFKQFLFYVEQAKMMC